MFHNLLYKHRTAELFQSLSMILNWIGIFLDTFWTFLSTAKKQLSIPLTQYWYVGTNLTSCWYSELDCCYGVWSEAWSLVDHSPRSASNRCHPDRVQSFRLSREISWSWSCPTTTTCLLASSCPGSAQLRPVASLWLWTSRIFLVSSPLHRRPLQVCCTCSSFWTSG